MHGVRREELPLLIFSRLEPRKSCSRRTPGQSVASTFRLFDCPFLGKGAAVHGRLCVSFLGWKVQIEGTLLVQHRDHSVRAKPNQDHYGHAHIDWILWRGSDLKLVAFQVDTALSNGLPPSDHFPIVATFRVRRDRFRKGKARPGNHGACLPNQTGFLDGCRGTEAGMACSRMVSRRVSWCNPNSDASKLDYVSLNMTALVCCKPQEG